MTKKELVNDLDTAEHLLAILEDINDNEINEDYTYLQDSKDFINNEFPANLDKLDNDELKDLVNKCKLYINLTNEREELNKDIAYLSKVGQSFISSSLRTAAKDLLNESDERGGIVWYLEYGYVLKDFVKYGKKLVEELDSLDLENLELEQIPNLEDPNNYKYANLQNYYNKVEFLLY